MSCGQLSYVASADRYRYLGTYYGSRIKVRQIALLARALSMATPLDDGSFKGFAIHTT